MIVSPGHYKKKIKILIAFTQLSKTTSPTIPPKKREKTHRPTLIKNDKKNKEGKKWSLSISPHSTALMIFILLIPWTH